MSENKNKFIGFDRLKAAVSIEQVLERYGLLERLRKSGDSLSGPCPLHQGHNAGQFRVNLSKDCWICFGDCHAGGSIVDLVSRMEGIGIREAALLLQEWFGVTAENANAASCPTEVKPEHLDVRSFNPPLRFTLGPLDQDHPYVRERGLTADTTAIFGVGYCGHGLFRGWIAIPIHDRDGRLVGYAGRWPGVPPEGTSKYKLPRGFRKSLELFNQHRAARESTQSPLVVVEGFFDCMRVWQAGHRRVVALMGSMLSKAQEQRIAELAGRGQPVLLLFDGDIAGQKGAVEARSRLRKLLPVQTLQLREDQQPDGMTPQELLSLINGQVEVREAA